MVLSRRNLLGAGLIVAGGALILLAVGSADPVRLSIAGLSLVVIGLVIFASTGLLQRDYGSWMSQGRPPP